VLDAGLRRSVVQLATGAWWDPVAPGDPEALDRHGNPNVLTLDKGTSRLAQGPVAQTALVELERYAGVAPPVQAFTPPEIVARQP
jgi:biotin/methionine sulfoxide reductase